MGRNRGLWEAEVSQWGKGGAVEGEFSLTPPPPPAALVAERAAAARAEALIPLASAAGGGEAWTRV